MRDLRRLVEGTSDPSPDPCQDIMVLVGSELEWAAALREAGMRAIESIHAWQVAAVHGRQEEQRRRRESERAAAAAADTAQAEKRNKKSRFSFGNSKDKSDNGETEIETGVDTNRDHVRTDAAAKNSTREDEDFPEFFYLDNENYIVKMLDDLAFLSPSRPWSDAWLALQVPLKCSSTTRKGWCPFLCACGDLQLHADASASLLNRKAGTTVDGARSIVRATSCGPHAARWLRGDHHPADIVTSTLRMEAVPPEMHPATSTFTGSRNRSQASSQSRWSPGKSSVAAHGQRKDSGRNFGDDWTDNSSIPGSLAGQNTASISASASKKRLDKLDSTAPLWFESVTMALPPARASSNPRVRHCEDLLLQECVRRGLPGWNTLLSDQVSISNPPCFWALLSHFS